MRTFVISGTWNKKQIKIEIEEKNLQTLIIEKYANLYVHDSQREQWSKQNPAEIYGSLHLGNMSGETLSIRDSRKTEPNPKDATAYSFNEGFTKVQIINGESYTFTGARIEALKILFQKYKEDDTYISYKREILDKTSLKEMKYETMSALFKDNKSSKSFYNNYIEQSDSDKGSYRLKPLK
jgi:hypothetical protein